MTDKQLSATASTDQTAKAPEWRELGWLPFQVSLEVPAERFTVADLLALRPGQLVRTGWSQGTEVPLRANGQLIGWAEVEAVGDRIGARITELNQV